jgi:hypothetical protein
MAMRRSAICLALAAVAALAITAAGCGFGRADDTGRPIPGHSWGWVCPNGDAPDGEAGCMSADGATNADAIIDAGVPADGPAAAEMQSPAKHLQRHSPLLQ